MDNLTKYSPAILNNNGNLEASMCVTNIGEYVKLSDIKELLNSSHNSAMPKLQSIKDAFWAGHAAGGVRCPVELAYKEWQLRQ